MLCDSAEASLVVATLQTIPEATQQRGARAASRTKKAASASIVTKMMRRGAGSYDAY